MAVATDRSLRISFACCCLQGPTPFDTILQVSLRTTRTTNSLSCHSASVCVCAIRGEVWGGRQGHDQRHRGLVVRSQIATSRRGYSAIRAAPKSVSETHFFMQNSYLLLPGCYAEMVCLSTDRIAFRAPSCFCLLYYCRPSADRAVAASRSRDGCPRVGLNARKREKCSHFAS